MAMEEDALSCTQMLTPCLISRNGESWRTKTGRHMPGTEETRASETRQSSSAAQLFGGEAKRCASVLRIPGSSSIL